MAGVRAARSWRQRRTVSHACSSVASSGCDGRAGACAARGFSQVLTMHRAELVAAAMLHVYKINASRPGSYSRAAIKASFFSPGHPVGGGVRWHAPAGEHLQAEFPLQQRRCRQNTFSSRRLRQLAGEPVCCGTMEARMMRVCKTSLLDLSRRHAHGTSWSTQRH